MNPASSLPPTERKVIFWLGLTIWSLFGLAELFPEAWWGLHFHRFLSPAWKYGILLLALGSILSLLRVPLSLWERLPTGLSPWLVYGLVALGMGLLFWHFPIVDDLYGNAREYRHYLDERVTEMAPEYRDALLSLEFVSEGGRKTYTTIVSYLSLLTHWTYETCYRVFGLFGGLFFCLIWLSEVRRLFADPASRWLFVLLGLGSPFLLVFFGHIENYALVLAGELLWLIGLSRQVQNPTQKRLFALIIGILVLIKLHPTMVLLVPALVLSLLHQHLPQEKKDWLFSRQGIWVAMILPALLLLFHFYFIEFQDYEDDRNLNDGSLASDHLFLPIFSPAPPLDRYNLFSANHLWDFGQMLLFLSPSTLLVLGTVCWRSRQQARRRHRPLQILGLTLLLFIGSFFVINPLYSLPMDWDLFCLCAPPLLVFTLYWGKEQLPTGVTKALLPAVLGLTLLGTSVFVLHAQRQPYAYRMETLGKHIFKTYYLHGGSTLLFSLNLIENDPELYLKRKTALLKELKPYAILGQDRSYAELLLDDAIFYQRVKKDRKTAHQRLLEAATYAPHLPGNLFQLTESYASRGEYADALNTARKLVELQHPSLGKSLAIATHCSLLAQQYEEALQYAQRYQDTQESNSFMTAIYTRLLENDRVAQLSELFQRPSQ